MPEASPISADYTRPFTAARAAGVIAVGLAVAAALLPLDGPTLRAVASIKIGGDLKRELEFIQQYGDIVTVAIVAALIFLLDRGRARRIADLAVTCGAVALTAHVLKMLIGRPRPSFNESTAFLFPWGTHARSAHDTTMMHAWEFWRGSLSELWSMPSSHTAAAAALSVFLVRVYPALKPFAVTMVVIVGTARVLLTAHYPSDVVVGAAVGYAAARLVCDRDLGSRLLARMRPEKTSGVG